MFTLASDEYYSFYQYHLNWFISRNPGLEESFFVNAWKILDDRITDYVTNISSLNPVETLKILRGFKAAIAQFDKWNISKIKNCKFSKTHLNPALKMETNDLKEKLKLISRFELD
jgi:hypothetical protein